GRRLLSGLRDGDEFTARSRLGIRPASRVRAVRDADRRPLPSIGLGRDHIRVHVPARVKRGHVRAHGVAMPTHHLRTELQSDLEAVELGWDLLFDRATGSVDPSLLSSLSDWCREAGGNWILVGRETIACQIRLAVDGASNGPAHADADVCELVTVAGAGP